MSLYHARQAAHTQICEAFWDSGRAPSEIASDCPLFHARATLKSAAEDEWQDAR